MKHRKAFPEMKEELNIQIGSAHHMLEELIRNSTDIKTH